jgi:hypothetical protein
MARSLSHRRYPAHAIRCFAPRHVTGGAEALILVLSATLLSESERNTMSRRGSAAVLGLCSCLAVALLPSLPAHASKDSTLQIKAMPKTVDEFKALRDDLPKTPQGGVAAMIVAMTTYSDNAKLGTQFLTLAIDSDQLTNGQDGVSGKQPAAGVMRDFKDRNGAKPYVAKSAFQGTSPQTGYVLPSGPLTIKFKEQDGDVKEAFAKIFVYTSGADAPKPMQLKKNDKGIWKAHEWSSFQGNCRPPEVKKVDDL